MNVRRLQLLSVGFAGSIFVLIGLRLFFIDPAPNPSANIVWLWVLGAPVVLVVPGMLRLAPRSYLLAALAGMFYFCHGVWLAVAPDLRAFGAWEAGFAVALVATATLALRALKRDQ